MGSQLPLEQLLGSARLIPYQTAANGDADRALELYLWATQVSGALHAQLSFVEIAVRNALDVQLAVWNTSHGYGQDWSNAGKTAQPLYGLLGKHLKEARGRADREAGDRAHVHPRYRSAPNHDDIVAQLMFGAWVRLVRPPSPTEASTRQQTLWQAALYGAFPNVPTSDTSRVEIGDQLEALRKLRNRVAHHDNLLQVKVTSRLNGMLSLLAKMDPDYPALAMTRSPLRQLVKEDPRKTW